MADILSGIKIGTTHGKPKPITQVTKTTKQFEVNIGSLEKPIWALATRVDQYEPVHNGWLRNHGHDMAPGTWREKKEEVATSEATTYTISLTPEQIGTICNALNRSANHWEDAAYQFKGEPSETHLRHSQRYHDLRNAIMSQIGGE